MSGDNLLAARARAVLEAHWQPEGYCVPNDEVYPHQWLWDSCFHAVVWTHLGSPDRAVAELRNVFAHQAADGFVPHLTYWRLPDLHAGFWGRRSTSCITQPPMYGHALAELHRHGHAVPSGLVEAAARGLEFLVQRRVVVHPWETGCDDSPRWDAWAGVPRTVERWRAVKGELVEALELDPLTGSPVGSRGFAVAAASFDALVAFNLDELRSVAGGPDASARAIADDLRARWDAALGTFVDAVRVGPSGSAGARTLESLLPVLVLDPAADADVVDAVFAQVRDPAAFGGRCGPAQTHRAEPAFDPTGYWRGAAWPQLTYLLWVAAGRHGRDDDARWLAERLVTGAEASGFAEHWHPDSGARGGAAPQSWTALAAVVAEGARPVEGDDGG